MVVIMSKEKLLKSLIPTKHIVSCRVIANKRKFGKVERACLLSARSNPAAVNLLLLPPTI